MGKRGPKPQPRVGCSVGGCDQVAVRLSKGWCEAHYKRWWKYGDPTVGQPLRRLPPEVRFWAYVNKNGVVPERRPDLGQCWLWTKRCDAKGYGQCMVWGKADRSHLVAYRLLVGPIPEGLQLDHLCMVTSCCNPAHLEPVTNAENMRRQAKARTHCVHGHEYTPENTYHWQGKPRTCKTCYQQIDHRRNLVTNNRSRNRSGYVRPTNSTQQAHWRVHG